MRAILTYHSVDSSGSVISVDEDALRHQADWLADGPVEVVPLERLLELSDEDEAIAITFDDGFENFGSTAWPILRDRGLPATVFVVTGHVGGSNDWENAPGNGIPDLPLLDWSALAQLMEDGASIGSHTVTHPRLAGLESTRLEDEIAGSSAIIERELGVRPVGFAYPYGSVDDKAATSVASSYGWACTTELTALAADSKPHKLPRLDTYYFRRRGQLESWGSVGFRARLALRGVARMVRASAIGMAG